jgi:hypothetical protein
MITSGIKIQDDFSPDELRTKILQIGGGELELWKLSVLSDKKVFTQIYSLISSDEPKIAWRSCWIIDNATENNPGMLVPLIRDIVAHLNITKNGSLKRHFTRMLSRLKIPDEFLVQVVNRCFELLSPLEAVAVRANAMQVLFNISLREPDLKQELSSVLESLIEEGGTAGFLNRAQKLLKQLTGNKI